MTPDLNVHAGYKVAHHASKEAIHSDVVRRSGAGERSWVTTPYNKGERLPRFEDHDGIDQLHAFERQLLLTALPVGIASQLPMPARVARTDLLKPETIKLRRPQGRLGPPVASGRPTVLPVDCVWAIQFDDCGHQVARFRGAAATAVV
jgi:hypothetical protein